MLPFVFQNRGSLANVQSPAVTQAVNYYVGLIKSGLAATPDKLGAGWCGEALGKETAAIIFEGNWVLPAMKSTFSQVRYGVFPMVKGKTGGNLGFTVSYSMAKDAKNKQAAWTVLSWLTGRVGQKLWISKGLALPSRTDLKPLGGRKAFLAAAPFVRGWGFPNFSEHVHDHEQRPAVGDRRKQDGRRDAGQCGSVAEEVGSMFGLLPCGRPARKETEFLG